MNEQVSKKKWKMPESLKIGLLLVALVGSIGYGCSRCSKEPATPAAPPKVLTEIEQVSVRFFKIGVECGAQATVMLANQGETNISVEMLQQAAVKVFSSRKWPR